MGPAELLQKIAGVLKKLNIPYVVTGGIAVTVWGRPRFTADIDIGIELIAAKLEPLAKELLKFGDDVYVDRNMMYRALQRRGEFNFIHPYSALKVDFWVLKDRPFDREEIKRRVKRRINKHDIFFISPEDLILRKLLWYQDSQSDRQLEDVASVIKRQKRLDWPYLWKWSKKQGTVRILRELKTKAKRA